LLHLEGKGGLGKVEPALDSLSRQRGVTALHGEAACRWHGGSGARGVRPRDQLG